MTRGKGGRRHRVRAHMSNPRRRRRRHRRNPGIPLWGQVALAALAAVATYAVVSDGAFAITQRTDPSMGTLVRNRYILGGLAFAAGIALALTVSPVYGVAVAAAAAIGSGAGTSASLALGKVLDKPLPGSTTTTAAQTTKGLAAVYAQNLAAVYAQNLNGMGAYAQLGAYTPMQAVYAQNLQGMGAYQQMGEYVPPAPFLTPTPF